MASALNEQIAGGHYKDRKIQPIEFISANGLNFCEGSIVKYIVRWRQKNGIEDLLKIKHYVDLLIELEGLNEEVKDMEEVTAAYKAELNRGRAVFPPFPAKSCSCETRPFYED